MKSIKHSDYVLLLAALEEALDGWDKYSKRVAEHIREDKRIAELRKLIHPEAVRRITGRKNELA